MSATPGKVIVDGTAEIGGESLLQLRFMQGREPALTGRPFFARLDRDAAWLDELDLVPGTPPDILEAVQSQSLTKEDR